MDDSGNVAQNGEEDVDEQVGIAAALEEDTERREQDGEDDLADVAAREKSFVSLDMFTEPHLSQCCVSHSEVMAGGARVETQDQTYLAVKAMIKSLCWFDAGKQMYICEDAQRFLRTS